MRYTVFADKNGPKPNAFPHEGDWECIVDRVSLRNARVAANDCIAHGYTSTQIFNVKSPSSNSLWKPSTPTTGTRSAPATPFSSTDSFTVSALPSPVPTGAKRSPAHDRTILRRPTRHAVLR